MEFHGRTVYLATIVVITRVCCVAVLSAILATAWLLVNVSFKDSIADIRHFVGLHDIELLYKQRLANFV